MSDYISKSALMKYLRDYKWEFALGSDFSKAIEMVDVQPTLDEKEIIRKPMERILTRFENKKKCADIRGGYHGEGEYCAFIDAIEIVKEECGINE